MVTDKKCSVMSQENFRLADTHREKETSSVDSGEEKEKNPVISRDVYSPEIGLKRLFLHNYLNKLQQILWILDYRSRLIDST